MRPRPGTRIARRRYVAANAMSASRRVPKARLVEIVEGYLTLPFDVLGICETSRVDVPALIASLERAGVVEPGDLVGYQAGPRGVDHPDSALALVVRHPANVQNLHLRHGTPNGRNVRARPILAGRVDKVPVSVGHSPLPKTGLRERFLNTMGILGGVAMLDGNAAERTLERTWGSRFDAVMDDARRPVVAVVAPRWRNPQHLELPDHDELPGRPDHGVAGLTVDVRLSVRR